MSLFFASLVKKHRPRGSPLVSARTSGGFQFIPIKDMIDARFRARREGETKPIGIDSKRARSSDKTLQGGVKCVKGQNMGKIPRFGGDAIG